MMIIDWTHGLNDNESYLDSAYSSMDTRHITKWANDAVGAMVDVLDDNVLRFVDYDYKPGHADEVDALESNHPTEDEELECPIVAEGFVVYWLRYRNQKGTADIFEEYFSQQKQKYVISHKNEPDAWERNLEEEFTAQKHVYEELDRIEHTGQVIRDYISEEDVTTIKAFAENYLRFVRRKSKKLFPPKYPENRKIEDEFINTFSGPAHECMVWIRDEYNIPYIRPHKPYFKQQVQVQQQQGQPLTEGQLMWKRHHDIVIPRYVRWEFEDYNNDVLLYVDGGLMEEIENNLRSFKDKEEQIRYIISLLVPFKEFADAFHPMGRIKQREREIEMHKKAIEAWKEVKEGEIDSRTGKPWNPAEHIAACKQMIEHCHEDIAYWNEVADKFFDIVQKVSSKDKGTMEYYLSVFWENMITFARRLASLLLTFHIKLMDIQKKSGIYLLWRIDLTDYEDRKYIPDFSYARQLLEEIGETKRESEVETRQQPLASKKTSTSTRIGRPAAKKFEEYLKADAPQELITILEEMLKDKKGKDAARIIIAITGIWIDEPATESICEKFPSVKSSAFNEAKSKHYGTNKYIDAAEPFREDELETIRTEIRQKLQNLNEEKPA